MRLLSLCKSLLRHATSDFKRLKKSFRITRLAICRSCEKYSQNGTHPKCTECGCYLNTKASWASEDCPLKKWPLVLVEHTSRGCGGCG